MNGQDLTLDDFCDAVAEAIILLREGGNFDHPLPLPGDATDWIREVYTDHRGPVRMRSKMPKGSSRYGRALAGMLRWHRSGGNLEGMMIARMNAGDQAEEVDSLATLILVLTKQGSSAMDAWRRTGLFG